MQRLKQLFNKEFVTTFGPDKLLNDLAYDEMEVGFDCGGGTYKVTKEEIEKFVKLTGDSNPYCTDESAAKSSPYKGLIAPTGMIYIYGLRICWDRKVFIDKAVRMGDYIEFYKDFSWEQMGCSTYSDTHVSRRSIGALGSYDGYSPIDNNITMNFMDIESIINQEAGNG